MVPNVIGDYNKNMGGVDKSDQHLAYYPVGHHNKKWWRYIFHSFVNLCIIVQELCESRGGRPGLAVLRSLLVCVDVKLC